LIFRCAYTLLKLILAIRRVSAHIPAHGQAKEKTRPDSLQGD
jgi:hypothetical protein